MWPSPLWFYKHILFTGSLFGSVDYDSAQKVPESSWRKFKPAGRQKEKMGNKHCCWKYPAIDWHPNLGLTQPICLVLHEQKINTNSMSFNGLKEPFVFFDHKSPIENVLYRKILVVRVIWRIMYRNWESRGVCIISKQENLEKNKNCKKVHKTV